MHWMYFPDTAQTLSQLVSHVVFTITLPRSLVICGKWTWGSSTAGTLGGREACE